MTIPTSMLNKVPDITFKSGPDAEAVLEELKTYIKVYGRATVAEYRMFANLPVIFADYKRGWTDLEEARIIYSKGEFMLDMPLAEKIL